MFRRYGAPFLYEHPLLVYDRGSYRIWHPDFRLPTYGGLIVEYAGMPDVPDYMAGIRHKEQVFRSHRLPAVFLYPWDIQGSDWHQGVMARIEDAYLSPGNARRYTGGPQHLCITSIDRLIEQRRMHDQRQAMFVAEPLPRAGTAFGQAGRAKSLASNDRGDAPQRIGRHQKVDCVAVAIAGCVVDRFGKRAGFERDHRHLILDEGAQNPGAEIAVGAVTQLLAHFGEAQVGPQLGVEGKAVAPGGRMNDRQ